MSFDGAPSEVRNEALKAVFMGAFNRVDRLPALQTAFERAAAVCTDYLRDAAVPPPEMTLHQIEFGTAADMLEPHDGHSVVVALNATQWNARLLASANRSCVYAIVEMMLGGDGSQPPYTTERPFSKVELGVVRTFFERMATAMEMAFAPIAKSAFTIEDATDRVDFDVIGRRNTPVIVARLGLRIWQQAGEILIVMPKAAIDPMRQALGRAVQDDTKKADPRWSSQIQNEITRTSVTLSAVLDERLAPLQDIAGLKVGQILRLNATPETRVRVECNGEPLLWCRLGKSNGNYTLRVEEPVDRDQEFMNDILGG